MHLEIGQFNNSGSVFFGPAAVASGRRGECLRFQNLRRRIARGQKNLADRACLLVFAILAAMIGGDADARRERQRPIGDANNVGEADVFGRFGELIAAVAPALAAQDSALAQFQQNLFQEFARHPRFVRDVGNHHRLLAVMFGKNDERMQRVAAFLREHG